MSKNQRGAFWQAPRCEDDGIACPLEAECGETNRCILRELRLLGMSDKQTTGWQPIETAPRDGTDLLLYANGDYYVACWDHAWIADFTVLAKIPFEQEAGAPTHWMPLPAPPGESA